MTTFAPHHRHDPRPAPFFSAFDYNDRYTRPLGSWFWWTGMLLLALFGNDRYISAEEPQGSWQAGLHFSVDNDAFSGQDDHYTNGFQIWVGSHALQDHGQGPLGAVGRMLGRLPGQHGADRLKVQSLSLSQRIFTPEDIHSTGPVRDDMPYSGHLLLGLAVSGQSDRHLDAWHLQLGLVGPAALAEETQTSVHELIGGDEPMGWDHQLPNEPVLDLGYEHRWRWLRAQGDDWAADALLTGGATLGTLLTQAQVGMAWRAGYHLPDDFAVPAPFLGEEAIGRRSPDSAVRRPFATWVYAHADLAAIAHATFWDGTLFRSSPSIDRDPLLARVQVGVHQGLPRLDLDAAFVVQSVPWDNPDDRRIDSYGRLAVTFRH